MGELQEKREEELVKHSQNEVDLQERLRHPGNVVTRMYGSMDAAKVRIELRPHKGEEKEEHESCWTMPSNGCPSPCTVSSS